MASKYLRRKSGGFLVRGDQSARLRDEAVGVGGCGGLVRVQGFIDHDDELRELVQPGEPRIVEHESEILARGRDPFHVALVHAAFGVEQRFVKVQKSVAQVFQALLSTVGHRLHTTVTCTLRTMPPKLERNEFSR